MDSPDFVRLLSYSSWFCMDSLYVSYFCVASFLQLLVLFGFHNSNPKRSGTSDFILIFQQFLHGFSPGFVRLLSYSSWFCMDSLYVSWFCAASFLQLLVLFGFHNSNPKWSGTSDFILTFQQFAWILSWFCAASFPQLLVLFGFHNSLNTNPKRSGTSDFILTFVKEQLKVSYGTRTSSYRIRITIRT